MTVINSLFYTLKALCLQMSFQNKSHFSMSSSVFHECYITIGSGNGPALIWQQVINWSVRLSETVFAEPDHKDLSIIPQVDGTVKLTWIGPTDGLHRHYRIKYHSMETQGMTETVEVQTETTTLTVSDLDGDAQYMFRVEMLAVYGEFQEAVSSLSDTVTTCESVGNPLVLGCAALMLYLLN